VTRFFSQEQDLPGRILRRAGGIVQAGQPAHLFHQVGWRRPDPVPGESRTRVLKATGRRVSAPSYDISKRLARRMFVWASLNPKYLHAPLRPIMAILVSLLFISENISASGQAVNVANGMLDFSFTINTRIIGGFEAALPLKQEFLHIPSSSSSAYRSANKQRVLLGIFFPVVSKSKKCRRY